MGLNPMVSFLSILPHARCVCDAANGVKPNDICFIYIAAFQTHLQCGNWIKPNGLYFYLYYRMPDASAMRQLGSNPTVTVSVCVAKTNS
jgi:hypothetical protein